MKKVLMGLAVILLMGSQSVRASAEGINSNCELNNNLNGVVTNFEWKCGVIVLDKGDTILFSDSDGGVIEMQKIKNDNEGRYACLPDPIENRIRSCGIYTIIKDPNSYVFYYQDRYVMYGEEALQTDTSIYSIPKP